MGSVKVIREVAWVHLKPLKAFRCKAAEGTWYQVAMSSYIWGRTAELNTSKQCALATQIFSCYLRLH